MEVHNKTKTVYVVLSNTGALTAKILHRFTKAEYNHSSISVKEDLSVMYSFGRRWKYWALCGGYVKESIRWGLLSRFPETKIVVMPFAVTQEQYTAISKHLEEMHVLRKKYNYDWIGLFLAPFRKKIKRSHHYYCSEFVKEMLVNFGLAKEEDFPYITTPNDFLRLYGDKKIYEGKLCDFASIEEEEEKEVI